MAKYREIPCKYYICYASCSLNREAAQTGYCQRCGDYIPRAKGIKRNKKKAYFEKGDDRI